MKLPEIGHNLPEIGTSQEWCCSNGCGSCRPVERDFVYHRVTDEDGEVLTEATEKVWVSHCCGADLELWDEDKQDFVESPLA